MFPSRYVVVLICWFVLRCRLRTTKRKYDWLIRTNFRSQLNSRKIKKFSSALVTFTPTTTLTRNILNHFKKLKNTTCFHNFWRTIDSVGSFLIRKICHIKVRTRNNVEETADTRRASFPAISHKIVHLIGLLKEARD